MKRITYTEAQARRIQNWGEQDPRIYNAEMRRWRRKWNQDYAARSNQDKNKVHA